MKRKPMSDEEMDELDRLALEHRRKNFKAVCRQEAFSTRRGPLMLSITHNGTHWNSFDLLPEEIDVVIKVLQEAKHQHEAMTKKPR